MSTLPERAHTYQNHHLDSTRWADTFINKGTNGRWKGVLDDEDLALYDQAMGKLPADYAQWLENGGPVATT